MAEWSTRRYSRTAGHNGPRYPGEQLDSGLTATATPRHRVPFGRFFLGTALQAGTVFGLFALLAPGSFRSEIARPGWALLWMLGFGVPLSLFEYLYHRYLLHSAILPFLGSMHKAHAQHHKLTAVKAPVRQTEPARMVPVHNRFPIVEEPQEEDAMFPWYALSIFYALFVPILGLPVKLLLPTAPAVTGVLAATTLYLIGYEMWHALLHMPYERYWRPLVEGRATRRLGRYVYGFHLMHHWRPSCNLAIVGLWGYALWDHVFRTHQRPERLPLAGREVNYYDAALPKSRWPIALLDRQQATLYRWARQIERRVASLFRRADVAS